MQLKISPLYITSVLFVAKATAWSDPYNHTFIAPTAADWRSPCPGLNTLANHGYINRDGMNITIEAIMNGALDAFNVNWDTILVAAKFGLLSGSDATTFSTLGLGPLSLHNLVEHDASISRNDYGPDGTGDNVHFNETTFQTLANANPGFDYYDPTSAGMVQSARLADSVANNPNVTNTQKEFLLRSRESGLYLSIFGNATTGVAPKEFVQIFFREERLPIEEGWTKGPTLITVDTLRPIETVIRNASDWTEQAVHCEPLLLGSGITFN
ncbi:Cloroperoxidase [Mycena maculata]|uniref:Cloroperoxidase n=1 Tax=Mycena maculata TaxID=230809 RepID=A0AAD7NBK4_9AGAR|nr:Cloroperoxidase [Mycena maculata]